MSSNLNSMENSDSGGVGAKKGFLYQDYAAALYVISMIRNKKIKAVRCEVTDDIDIIYDNYIEYVQVKTTDSNTKWGVVEFCKTSTAKKVSGKRSIKPTDSILHKSLGCDKHKKLTAKFRILTPRDVSSSLTYLKIDYSARTSKDGKDELLKSLSKKIKDFKSENGNDINYWIDNAFWEVKNSIEELILKAHDEIMKAAIDSSIYLDSNRDPNIILNDVLATVTNKSAISRQIHTASDKSYMREDFISWFDEEINIIARKSKSHAKVYTRNTDELKQLFLELVSIVNPEYDKKYGLGLKQNYFQNEYRFDYIAKTLVDWLPELLLRPSELADTHGINFIEKWKSLGSRLGANLVEFETFTGKLLLHSTIRYFSKSQPVSASLYIDDGADSFHEFENIHIVKHQHNPDELWMGFSKLSNSLDIKEPINEICKELNFLITNCFDKQREKILNVKEDNYLFKHDINEMLNAAHSLDDYVDRFRFVIFLGYTSEHLKIIKTKDNMEVNYEDILKQEVEEYFNLQINELSKSNSYFEELKVTVYLYPTPCIDTMLSVIKNELEGIQNVKWM